MSYILFRTRRGNIRTKWGNSERLWKIQWDIWDSLRTYSPWDRIRDIFWGKSLVSEIFVKNRNASESFDIITTTDGSLTGFFTPSEKISPRSFFETSKYIIEKSAKQWWYPFSTIENITTVREKIHVKNAMICVFSNHLEEKNLEYLKYLSSVNDVIFIHTFHPFEISPDDSLLFGFRTIKVQKYQKEWKNRQKYIESYIKSLWCGYISIHTHESISKKMNIFFKNRYRYG